MIAVLTPDEVRAIDAAAPVPVEVLIGRAGAAVAREAVDLLGGAYGRRVVVIAGKGNNGNDGRVAAGLLRRRGARVEVVEPTATTPPACDLVIDAAFGTGFRGEWEPPPVDAPVLAVDIPSGMDPLTGGGRYLCPERTVTFVGVKQGLLFGDGGEVAVADIGLDGSSAAAQLVEDDDVRIPGRRRDDHKWRAAVWVVAGSPGMTGAAVLAAAGAQRAGAGYVRLSVPGGDAPAPTEVVVRPMDWALEDADRFGALVVGPGLGRDSDSEVRRLVGAAPVPVVVDGDGLSALGPLPTVPPTTVLTPHDGEYERLAGRRPPDDRLEAARSLAARTGAVVLLKGPSTVVAEPGGRVLVAAAGDSRLATAGTGDVLAGVIGAFIARGVPPFAAAAWGAHVHGVAAQLGPASGLVAGDLPKHLPQVLASLPVG